MISRANSYISRESNDTWVGLREFDFTPALTLSIVAKSVYSSDAFMFCRLDKEESQMVFALWLVLVAVVSRRTRLVMS